MVTDSQMVLKPVYQKLDGGNNLLKFSIKCYEGESTDEYILNSNLNPEVFYTAKRTGFSTSCLNHKAIF
jgi:hypothetical protein